MRFLNSCTPRALYVLLETKGDLRTGVFSISEIAIIFLWRPLTGEMQSWNFFVFLFFYIILSCGVKCVCV